MGRGFGGAAGGGAGPLGPIGVMALSIGNSIGEDAEGMRVGCGLIASTGDGCSSVRPLLGMNLGTDSSGLISSVEVLMVH